jgi:hypothetical protein
MRNGILALSLAAAIAAANPVPPKFLTEVGWDSTRGQWVEIRNDWGGGNLCGWQISTGQSSLVLDCTLRLWEYLVVDSALLARDDSAHGTFRFNPAGDMVHLNGLNHEYVSFPRLPAGPATAPAFPFGSSISCWGAGSSCCWYVDSSPTPGQGNDDYGVISGSLVGVPRELYSHFSVTASGPSARVAGEVDYQWGTFYLGGLSPGRYRVTASAWNSGDTWVGAAADSIELGYAETRSGVQVYVSWPQCASMPLGNKGKQAKDGACLASLGSSIYALKGNRTCEFYRYDMRIDGWRDLASIPAVGRLGQNKPVSKGATLCAMQGKLYATKGCGTAEFWEFTPDTGQGAWVQRADVPPGTKRLGAGASSTALVFVDTAWVYLLRGAGTSDFYRYNPQTDSWQQQTGPPLTPSSKAFGAGSAMTSDASHTLYVLKGRTNEFYNYDLLTKAWSSVPGLPLVGSSRHKHKAGNGAGLAYIAADTTHPTAYVYALKGGNSLESWRHAVGQPSWTQMEDLPLGHHKRVGAGGAITASERMLYALKGSKTLEFYTHPPDPVSGPPELRTANPSTEGIERSVTSQFTVSPSLLSRSVTISYALPRDRHLRIDAFDAAGRLVEPIFKGAVQAPGSITWQPRTLRKGIYFLRVNDQVAKLIRVD